MWFLGCKYYLLFSWDSFKKMFSWIGWDSTTFGCHFGPNFHVTSPNIFLEFPPKIIAYSLPPTSLFALSFGVNGKFYNEYNKIRSLSWIKWKNFYVLGELVKNLRGWKYINTKMCLILSRVKRERLEWELSVQNNESLDSVDSNI